MADLGFFWWSCWDNKPLRGRFKLQGVFRWAIGFLFWRRYSQQAQTSRPSVAEKKILKIIIHWLCVVLSGWSDLSLDPLVHLHKHVHSWGPSPKQPSPEMQLLIEVLHPIRKKRKSRHPYILFQKVHHQFQKFYDFFSSVWRFFLWYPWSHRVAKITPTFLNSRLCSIKEMIWHNRKMLDHQFETSIPHPSQLWHWWTPPKSAAPHLESSSSVPPVQHLESWRKLA